MTVEKQAPRAKTILRPWTVSGECSWWCRSLPRAGAGASKDTLAVASSGGTVSSLPQVSSKFQEPHRLRFEIQPGYLVSRVHQTAYNSTHDSAKL
jgi:hypothetical protein